ncbi:hypothetical protein VHEMI09230 [[Torrubiella] hemipterigena]|uniref:Hydrophobin n=1 Tax=[Torrubiella] hemipterigena TaxID=1531966 RepID=A0A0A1TFW1_9HYPO|nr:hypothetical protein VHEMI09230 [[Torrubiella] hemipterigena]
MVSFTYIATAFAFAVGTVYADDSDCTTSTTPTPTTTDCPPTSSSVPPTTMSTICTTSDGGNVGGSSTTSAKPEPTPAEGEYCGSGMELNCCNRQINTETADIGPHQSGLLAGLANGVLGGDGSSLLGDCSPIDVASLIGGGALLNGQTCEGRVACCNRSQAVAVGGLINLALPCIAIGSIAN